MLPLILCLTLAAPDARAATQPYAMPDIGITIQLDKRWADGMWSNYDFSGKSKDGTQLKVWSTPYQLPVTEANARGWAEMYAKTMEKEGFADIKIERVAVEKVAGRPTARVELSMRPRSGGAFQAVYHGAAFEGPGQVLHLYTISLARVSDRSQRELDEILNTLTVEKGPLALPGPQLSTPAGFAATLPDGWRPPLAEELPGVLSVTAKMGEEELDPARCWSGIRPAPDGDPDVIFACEGALYLGPVDELSFADEEPAVREQFFGKLEPPVAAAEPAQVGDRTGFYFRPAQDKEQIRLVVAPYGVAKVIKIWAYASHLDGPALDADLGRLLPTVQFTGDNGGKPQIGLDRWVGYYLRHKLLSPLGLVCVGVPLVILALIVRSLTKKKPAPAEY